MTTPSINDAGLIDTEGAVGDMTPDLPISIPGLNPQQNALAVSGLNTVIVGAQAQQNMSSLANVNAAGAIVPVMINFVININSKVNGLSNRNEFNMDDYYRYQVR